MHSKSLDNFSTISNVDTQGMLMKIGGLPQDLKKAFALSIKQALPSESNFNAIVFAGLGGSAIAGEIVSQKLFAHSTIPYQVVKKSSLPAFVNEKTLCIFLSYSGNTKETLSCYKEALKRKALTVAITAGGEIEKLSKDSNTTLIKLPSGYQPRAALGLLTGATLGCLSKTGLAPNLPAILQSTASLLEKLKDKYAPNIPTAKNLAKQLAYQIFDKLPLIYTCESLGEAVAARWKNQLNENAKMMAFSNVFPELAHNEIMASNQAAEPIIIHLKNPDEEAESLIANNIALRLMKESGTPIIEVASEGESQLEKMLSLIILGDFVSTYLAILYQVDPTPVENIETLKEELKQKVVLKTKTLDTIEL